VSALKIPHSAKSARNRFQRYIRPALASFREKIDPELALRIDELRGPCALSQNKALLKCTADPFAIPSLPLKSNRNLSSQFKAMDDVDDEDMSIDVEGFTQTQSPAYIKLGDVATTQEKTQESPPVDPSLKAQSDTKSRPESAVGREGKIGEEDEPHLPMQTHLSQPSNEESKRLDSLKKPITSSGESSIRLSNRYVGTSSREAVGANDGSDDDAEMDSFEKLFCCEKKKTPSLGEKKKTTPPRGGNIERGKEPKQAQTIEEVVDELCSFYVVTPEVARKALRDARFSVKGAICRIINGKAVSTIEQCHNERS